MISRTTHPSNGQVGWQWGAGPIFIGESGPALAVQWGQATETLDLLTEVAQMQEQEAWDNLGRQGDNG